MRSPQLSLLSTLLFIASASSATLPGHHLGHVHAKRDLTVPRTLLGSWTYTGCYTDDVNARSLSADAYTDFSGMTDETCINYCDTKGYTVAGTEYSRECYCGFTLSAASTSVDDAECNMACTGDSTEPCGGPVRLSVFSNTARTGPSTNPGSPGWNSLGCYSDETYSRTLPYRISTPDSGMTVAYCNAACASLSYTYSGVEYSSECYCGNSIAKGSPAADGCDMTCSGLPSEWCGGPNRLNLYQATSFSNSVWSSLGCYTDSVSARTLSVLQQVDGGDGMTIEGCLDACSASGYALAGLEYAGECYCDNVIQYARTIAPDGDAQCNMPCKGNSSEICGGPNRLNLYSYGPTASPTASGSSSTPSITPTPSMNTTTNATSTIDNGPGTESTFAGPVNLGSVPQATLVPVSPPDIDMGSLDVLNADPETNLWFNGDNAGGDEADGAVTARVSVGFQYPSVVLDHSIYIQEINCSSGTVSASFNNPEAFQRATSQWTASSMVFVTSASGCGIDGQPLFLLSSLVTFNEDESFIISGQIVGLQDVYESLDIDFGNIQYDAPTPVSNNTYNATTCGEPTSSIIKGLPAVACGPSFDQDLDKALGFMADDGLSGSEVVSQAAPEVNVQRLGKRGFFDFISSIIHAIETVLDWIIDTVITVVKAVIAPFVPSYVGKALDWVADTAKTVVDIGVSIAKNAVKVASFIVTGDYSQSLTFPVNLVPPEASLVDSPWGDALKFYTWIPDEGGEEWTKSATALEKMEGLIGEPKPQPGIEFFCVNCGVSGQVVATGSVSATVISGLKSATISVNGNMYVGLYLGVNAFAQFGTAQEKELYTRGLPGWSIPGIVTLGPELSLWVATKLTVETEGQLLTGASVTWPSFSATLDFVDSSRSTQSGWVPQIQHTFQATGTLGATASIGLPVKLEFGIDILDGKFKKTVALVDTPALAANAELTISLDADSDTTITVGEDDCAGINWDISLTNEVSLEVTDIATYVLNEWASPPLADGCITIDISGSSEGSDGSNSGSTTTTASATTSVTPSASVASVPVIPSASSTPTGSDPQCLVAPYADLEFDDVPAGGVYTDNVGNKFNTYCSLNIGGDDYQDIYGQTIESCIEACHGVWACIAVDFYPYQSGRCSMSTSVAPNFRKYTSVEDEYETVVSAVLISPFTIYNVQWGPWDVTNYADVLHWVDGWEIDVYTPLWELNLGDPTPGESKHVHMIFSYGVELRSYSALHYSSTYNVIPAGPVVDGQGYNSRVVPTVTVDNPVSDYFSIVDIAFGQDLTPIDTVDEVWSNIYQAIYKGGGVTFDFDTFQTTGYSTADDGDSGRRIGTIFIETTSEPGIIQAVTKFQGTVAYPSDFGVPAKKKREPPAISRRQEASKTTTNNTTNADTTSNNTTSTNTTSNNTTSTNTTSTNTTSTNTTSTNTTSIDLVIFTIQDLTNTLQLNSAPNGNLFMSNLESSEDISSLISDYELVGDQSSAIIIGDSNSAFLHYYPSAIEATGVSRLRLATWDKLPHGARLINLVPFTDDSDASVTALIGVDTAANAYFPFMCGIDGQLNKVFLVNTPDQDDAMALLTQDGMEFIVTGGKVTECGPLALKVLPPAPGPDAQRDRFR